MGCSPAKEPPEGTDQGPTASSDDMIRQLHEELERERASRKFAEEKSASLEREQAGYREVIAKLMPHPESISVQEGEIVSSMTEERERAGTVSSQLVSEPNSPLSIYHAQDSSCVALESDRECPDIQSNGADPQLNGAAQDTAMLEDRRNKAAERDAKLREVQKYMEQMHTTEKDATIEECKVVPDRAHGGPTERPRSNTVQEIEEIEAMLQETPHNAQGNGISAKDSNIDTRTPLAEDI